MTHVKHRHYTRHTLSSPKLKMAITIPINDIYCIMFYKHACYGQHLYLKAAATSVRINIEPKHLYIIHPQI